MSEESPTLAPTPIMDAAWRKFRPAKSSYSTDKLRQAGESIERELAAVTAERDALLAAIEQHNTWCESACAARVVGADKRPCRDTYNGRMCPDCPREWIIDAALRRP